VGGVADLGEWNPGAAKGGGTHTVLLCAVQFSFSIRILLFINTINIIDQKQKNTKSIY
jgi:hypothetical protein